MPGGGGLGKWIRRDVRQGQHKRQRGVQGAFEPGENQVRPGSIPAAELSAKTILTVRWWFWSRVHDTYAVAARASAEKGEWKGRRRWRWRQRWQWKIETQLLFDIMSKL